MADISPDALSNLDALVDEGARFYATEAEIDALEEYERILEGSPRDKEALIGLAETLHHLGRLDEAFHAWQRVIAVMPERAVGYIHLGNVLYDLKRYEDALGRYARARKRDPKLATPHKQAGRVLLKLKRYQDALAAYEEANQLAAHDVFTLIGLGLAQEELGRADEALSTYASVLQIDPGQSEITYRAGRLTMRRRGPRQALALAKRILASNPRNHGAWLIQGDGLMGIGSYEWGAGCL